MPGSGLDADVFTALLARIDPDPDRAARRYVEIRQRLVRLLQWRGCANPDDLVDETMDRVARRLQQGAEIHAGDPYAYFAGVARFVLKEAIKCAASARSEGAPVVLRVPHGPGAVVLQVEAEAGPGELRAILRTARGEQVLVLGGLRRAVSGGLGVVDVRVQADLLTRGAYEVVLDAPKRDGSWETLGIHPFEVVRGQ